MNLKIYIRNQRNEIMINKDQATSTLAQKGLYFHNTYSLSSSKGESNQLILT